jgi:hypothetical protein
MYLGMLNEVQVAGRYCYGGSSVGTPYFDM